MIPRQTSSIGILIATLLFVSILLSGCIPKKTEVTNITYAFWGSREQQIVERQIVAAFEKENPDVKVELLPIGGRYADKIQAMLVGNAAPDVILMDLAQYDDWASRGVLEDVSPILEQIAKNDPILPIPRLAFERKNGIFALPINCCGYVLFYNKNALAASGLTLNDLSTWEGIAKSAKALSRRAGNPSVECEYAMLMPPPIIILWAFGAELFDSPTDPKRVTINSVKAEQAFTFIRQLNKDGLVPPTDLVQDQGSYQLFRDGQIAMMLNGRWITSSLAGHTEFAWDIAPAPAGPGGEATFFAASGIGIWKKSRNKDAASRFASFYASPKGAEIGMRGGRLLPPYRGLAFGTEFLSSKPPASMEVFSRTLENNNSRYPLFVPGAAEVFRILNGRISQALSEPLLPASTIVAGLELDLELWLKRYRKTNP